MNRKELKTLDEVEAFIEPLATGEFVIDIKPLPDDGGYAVEWQAHKTYVSYADGKEYPDELWRTEDGRLILVQDLEPEHCRNVLRMILRNDRLLEEKLGNLFESVMQAALLPEDSPEAEEPSAPKTLLH